MYVRAATKLTCWILIGCGLISMTGCDLFVDADTRVKRAEQYMAQQNDRAAMIELKNALNDDENHLRARVLLARVSLRLGEVLGADKELQRAIQLGASPADTAPLIAEIHLAQGHAEALLAQIDSDELPLPPDELQTVRGRALLSLQRIEPAVEAFNAALSVNPNQLDARVGLAEALAAQGRSDEAIAALEEALAIDPEFAQGSLVKGGILARRGEYEAARAAFERANQHAAHLTLPQRIGLFTLQGDSQLAQGDLAAAKQSHQQLSALAPQGPMTAMLGARIAMAEQDYVAATGMLRRVVSAAPNFAPARFLLGAALFAQGNLHQAQTQLQRSIEIAPENLQARKLLAKVHLRLARPDAAMEILLPAEQEEGVDALLGLARLQSGDTALGVPLLERSLASRPEDSAVRYELAAAYLRSGEHDKALKMARSLPRVPNDARRDELIIAATARTKGASAARVEAERLVAEFPRDVGALNAAAMFYARLGELDHARELLGRAGRIEPPNTTTLFNRARVDVSEGKLEAAAAALEQVTRIDAQNMAAKLALAEIALRAKDPERAIAVLERLRTEAADAIEPRLRLGAIYFAERRTRDAEAVLREVMARAGDRPEVLNAIGEIYLDNEQHAQALTHFRSAVRLAPQHGGYWFNNARAQLVLGNTLAAREVLHRCLELRAGWVPAVATLAMLDIREAKVDAALQRVAELKRTTPANPAVLTLEGDVLFALQRFDSAARAYDAAIELQPSSMLAMKSYRARRAAKMSDAAKPLQQWVAREPGDLGARMILAQTYQEARQHLRAIEEYQVIVAQSPNNAAALNNLAWLYHSEKDPRAEKVARRAYDISPSVPAIADTYGWILVGSGRAREGRDILRAAVQASPVPPEVQYHYAVALAKTGENSEALRVLKELVRDSTDFPERAEAVRLLEELSDS